MAPNFTQPNSLLFELHNQMLTAESPASIDAFFAISRPLPRFAQFRQYLIYHEGDLFETICHKFSDGNNRVICVNKSAQVIELKRTTRSGVFHSGYIAVLDGKFRNFFRILTVSYSDFWNIVVRRYVRKLYPEAIPVFIKQSELEKSLILFEKELGAGYRVRIIEGTMKSERVNAIGAKQKTLDTDRLWTDLPIKDVFIYATERGQWFTSVKFYIEMQSKKTKKYRKIAVGRINKQGQIFYTSNHTLISDKLIASFEDQAAKRFLLLSRRGLQERNYKPSKPIEIRYGHAIFSEVSEIHRLGDVIQQYPQSQKTVLHKNPYYHASIADFLEGSSFEVMVLSPDRILLIPQMRSTEKAFERLISHIFYEFREGEISEYNG